MWERRSFKIPNSDHADLGYTNNVSDVLNFGAFRKRELRDKRLDDVGEDVCDIFIVFGSLVNRSPA